jgi:uncharacterized protein YciI
VGARLVAITLSIGFAAAAAGGAARAEDPAAKLSVSQFVLFRPVPGAPHLGERERVRIQQEHLTWIQTLHDEGRVTLVGPVAGASDLAGVLVLDASTREEAEALVAGDPWVREGHLAPEVIPWWSEAAAIVRKPSHLLHADRVWLGLFVRPADAPSYDEGTLKEIQTGHLANLRKMADSGDLVLAGPFENEGRLRGVLVFRTQDVERIRELVAEDPAVKAGRLGVDLYPWSIPRGSLPEHAP